MRSGLLTSLLLALCSSAHAAPLINGSQINPASSITISSESISGTLGVGTSGNTSDGTLVVKSTSTTYYTPIFDVRSHGGDSVAHILQGHQFIVGKTDANTPAGMLVVAGAPGYLDPETGSAFGFAGLVLADTTTVNSGKWVLQPYSSAGDGNFVISRNVGSGNVYLGLAGEATGIGLQSANLANGTLIVRSTSTTAGNPIVDIQNNGGTSQLKVLQGGQTIASSLTVPGGASIGASSQTFSGPVTVNGDLNPSGNMAVGGNINGLGNVRAGSTGAFYWNARSQITSTSNGNATLTNLAGDAGSGQLVLGGVTAAYGVQAATFTVTNGFVATSTGATAVKASVGYPMTIGIGLVVGAHANTESPFETVNTDNSNRLTSQLTTAANDSVFRLYNAAGTAVTQIVGGSALNSYFNGGGSVGIGTASPGYPLEVDAVANSTVTVANTTPNGKAGVFLAADGSGRQSYLASPTNASGPASAGAGDGEVGTLSGAPFDLVTGKTVRVQIPDSAITTGGALCLNSSKVLSKCTTAVDASGNCTCP